MQTSCLRGLRPRRMRHAARSILRLALPITAVALTASMTALHAGSAPVPGATPSSGTELAPREIFSPVGEAGVPYGRFSPRTLRVGLIIDRDQAKVVGWTMKPHPYTVSLELPAARAHDVLEGKGELQLEIRLASADGTVHTRRVDAGPLCFAHSGDEPPHVAGDTIRVHRDALTVDLPEMAGFDRIEASFHSRAATGKLERVGMATASLDAATYTMAGGDIPYQNVAIARPDTLPLDGENLGTVFWPEAFSDPDVYRVDGNESEGAERINITILADGYIYSQKALMEAHADAMIAHFRNKTPYKEHDPFMNYTLVYAYGMQAGTTECDCGNELNTPFSTRFPDAGNPCGHSGNRCLYYTGGTCLAAALTNIIQAELRAPFHDETIIMVNTTRYGGCGGSRGVYSAANSAAVEVAVHELGHSAAGLADEYQGNSGCGAGAGGINTSTDGSGGDWAEWLPDIGAPFEGAQYYDQCVYRPEANCEMRSLNQPFCAVCNQHWSLVVFGHPRVSPTAPVASAAPDPAQTVLVTVGTQTLFSVTPRLSQGTLPTNLFEWTVEGQTFAGGSSLSWSFASQGQTTVQLRVVADTNFVKPSRYGANEDVVTWNVDVQAPTIPPEVSGPGTAQLVEFIDQTQMIWEDLSGAGATSYSIYRGNPAGLPGSYGDCLVAGLPSPAGSDPESPPPGEMRFYLVSASSESGEGTLGNSAAGQERMATSSCGG